MFNLKKVKVKIVSATNEPLDTLIKQNLFRQDLLERLRAYEILIPALREREHSEREEILGYLINKVNNNSRKKQEITNINSKFQISEELKEVLLKYEWKNGNVREMRNVLQSLAINSNYDLASLVHLPQYFLQNYIKNQNKAAYSNKTKEVSFPISYNNIENTLFLEILNKLYEKSPSLNVSYPNISKNLNISRWKCHSHLKKLEDMNSLPPDYQHLLRKQAN